MATARRTGAETSETRSRLLDITERVMVDEGYAAVSSRRIAKEAGVTPGLIHYYFPTLDDLFLEVLRHRGRQQQERLERILRSPQPLRALWSFLTEQASTGLLMELMALANHRKSIRKELAVYADEYRQIELQALSTHLQDCGLDPVDVPPEAVLVAMAALSRTLATERDLGMVTGLPETVRLVENLLERWEGPAIAGKDALG